MTSGDALFSWDALATLAGASLLTSFITQYFKGLMDRWAPGLPTDVFAVLIAWAVLSVAQIAAGAPAADWRLYILAFANAFLVAAAAGQMHNKALNPPGTTKTTTKTQAVTTTETVSKEEAIDAKTEQQ
ncbi:hypothetical protein [Cohnella sp. JJ-181]|uniref:hypothetical protein n=1 Tax=Cohnella rhizoplanae TaxID=2974897 RepID=UPI0022FF8D51|nr:hypothetical protein [Cohnella sp. JJ-181]CAI6086714.1 hypothetical protein COHCIP112018_05141 [Cohnella sp. JJ-181]